MAITTLAGVQAGLHPLPATVIKSAIAALTRQSFWYQVGVPSAGVVDTTTAGGVIRSSTGSPVTGQLYFPPASSNTYLASMKLQGVLFATSGNMHLCDRLWDCGADNTGTKLSTTVTTAQTINSTPWTGNRDAAGGNNGVGILIGLDVASAIGAAFNAGLQISYTNTVGTAGQIGGLAIQIPGQAVGSVAVFTLAAGDLGVQSVQSLTLAGSVVSGTISLFAYREIAVIEVLTNSLENIGDPLTLNFPRMFDGSVPFFMADAGAAAVGTMAGTILYAQG